MINIGTRREVFWDDFLIDNEKTTAELVLNKPVEKEIVMSFDEDWELGVSYVHFFFDEDINKFRMYYITLCHEKFVAAEPGDDHKKIRCCYAESDDGINWVKPDLGLHEWNGSKHNNIIFMAEWLDNFYVFKDTNPECPPEEKYKAIKRNDSNVKHGLGSYFSADGIHFTEGRFISREGSFDTLNIILWDEDAGKYRGYIRSFHDIPIKGGGDYMNYLSHCETGEKMEIMPGFNTDSKHKLGAGVLNLGVRDIRYIESEDFVTWTKPERLGFFDSEDIPLYTNQVSKYERAPHMFVGFPTRYKERQEWSKSFEVLCGKEKRLDRMEKLSLRHGLAMTDCTFMCSRDGINFKRYNEAFFRNGPENGNNWTYGDRYPAKGFLITKSQVEGADTELSMLCPEKCEEGYPLLRRYTVRMDGFASMHAGGKEKVIVTKPFVFEGNKLYANMSTSACGYMYFKITDTQGDEITSCEMFGDRIDKQIGFEGNLSDFAGKEVVLTVRMCDADLYAIKFDK